MGWKKNLSESEDSRFRRLWNHFILKNQAMHAFELYRMQQYKKGRDFESLPEAEQVKEYEAYLRRLKLIA